MLSEIQMKTFNKFYNTAHKNKILDERTTFLIRSFHIFSAPQGLLYLFYYNGQCYNYLRVDVLILWILPEKPNLNIDLV